ncbi:MAG TPA: thiamine pyrophosphate-binding protein [Thermoleophilaceae bacterium]|nr:thiamine pyrophosphate-binding protein [Thermoleophilaceae bacterium]
MSRNVAEAVVDELVEAGVEVVFGLPGVHNLSLFAALDASPIRTVVVRHEAAAAYAADAVGRLTGRPGVCVTTSGPGAANAITAMGEAQASRSPLLHITTTVARRHLDPSRSRGVLHEHPRQRDLFVPVSKVALHLYGAGAAADVRDALAVAAVPPQAPTYVELPTDLLDDEAAPAGIPDDESRRAVDRSPGGPRLSQAPELGSAEPRGLADRLAAAERPAIWVGSGAAACGASIAALAERLHAPVVLTHSAKRRWDAAPHPLVLAHPPHEPPVAELLDECDALLVLGSDLDGMMTQEFRLPLEPILRVDVDPERAAGDDRYASAQAVVADVAEVVEALLKIVPERSHGWGPQSVAAADAGARQALADDADARGGLAYLSALDAALGDRDAAVVCDMAVTGYWAGGYLPLRPARRILYPLGWGTLGFALPASIGAAVAHPGRAVAICGDGGALFAIGELATLAQERLDVTVVVHNDACYGMLRYDEERHFGRTFAVDLEAPDFTALARSFDIPAWNADLSAGRDFESALTAALATDGPSLVEVTGDLSPPRVTSARWPLAHAAA